LTAAARGTLQISGRDEGMAVAVETRNRTREKEISGYLLRSGPSATRGVAAARTPRPGRTGSARCPSGALDFEQAELGGDAAGGGYVRDNFFAARILTAKPRSR
jgi:hypothetical protein